MLGVNVKRDCLISGNQGEYIEKYLSKLTLFYEISKTRTMPNTILKQKYFALCCKNFTTIR